MEVQPSHIVSDESINMSSGSPKNSNTSCSNDLNNSYNRINVNNVISTNNGSSSIGVMPKNLKAQQVNPNLQENDSNTNLVAAAAPASAVPNRDFNSGVMFTPSASSGSGGGRDFRNTEQTSSGTTTVGEQGNTDSLQQTNLFATCTTTTSAGNSSNTVVDLIKNSDPNSGSNPEQVCSGSGINLACSETGSNLGEEDNKMDTGSVYSFRSDMDQESSCTMNGSQCSDNTGLHPTSSSMPRRTKNGILLRDRTNR